MFLIPIYSLCCPVSALMSLCILSPCLSAFHQLKLVPKLSRNYLKEGYMEKTGPKVGHAFFVYAKSKHILYCAFLETLVKPYMS